jgi:hypothetical protein
VERAGRRHRVIALAAIPCLAAGALLALYVIADLISFHSFIWLLTGWRSN